MPGPKEASADEGIDIRSLFVTLWRRKWLIAGLTFAAAALAYLLVSQVTPQYTARASVMLDARSVQVLDSADVVSDLTLNNPVLDSEVTVLRSNLLLRDVLSRFDREDLAALDPALEPPSLVSRMVSGLRGLISSAPDAEEAPPQAGALSEEDRWQRRMTGALRRSMTVWREGQSYVISVSVETRDPALSMQLANGIVETYIDRQLENRRDAVRDANAFLTARVETMRREVEIAETAVEDFRRDQLAVGGASPESLDRQLIDLSTQIAISSADLATAEARARQIRTVVETSGLEAAAELLTSPFVLSLREEKSELEREDLALSSRLSESHPNRERVRNAIAAVTETLAEEVSKIIATLENEVAVARIRQQSLRDSLTTLEERAADLSRASLELRQLERESEAIRASYEAALVRASETQSAESLQRADAVVIESASLPGAPSAPRTMLFTALGGTMGLAGGLILTVLMSLLGPGFSRVSDLEQSTGLPVVAALPIGAWKSVRKLLVSMVRTPYQPYVERLRQLRTTLAADGAPKVVLVTSCVPGEGKTTFSVAFSKLEAMSRRSCILLDFDMRKSNLADDLNYAPKAGDLADLFYGTCSVEDAICRDKGRGFDLLTTRSPTPHMFDQVTPAHLKNLIEDLSGRYDRVVIDTAPILSVADTLPLVRHADATVLLVRSRSTEQRAVSETLWRLRNMGADAINLVFSMVDGREGGESYGAKEPYLKK